MDTIKRSVVKTIFFKIITTSVTSLLVGLGNAIKIHILMTIIYLLYELAWRKINWGVLAEGEVKTKFKPDPRALIFLYGFLFLTTCGLYVWGLTYLSDMLSRSVSTPLLYTIALGGVLSAVICYYTLKILLTQIKKQLL